MINSTFGSFMTARLGMNVSQMALSITGQNIANISTDGYTRQRLDQVSLNVGGGSYRYASVPTINIGNGVYATGVSQIRDPFLDRRFRTEMGQVGEYDIWTSGLNELANILDETQLTEAGGGINNQLGDLVSKLNQLSENVGSKEFDNMVKSSAQVLTTIFNSYAKRLETIRQNQETDLRDVDIPAVNNILQSIKELNISIKNSQIHGDNALELQDRRNSLIDELSTYVNIEVSYKPVQISDATSVDELTINLVGEDGAKYVLVNDDDSRELTIAQDAGTGQWTIGLSAFRDDPATAVPNINDQLITGSLKSSLKLLNENGEFDDPTTSKGIGYYEKSLDLLAKQLAEAFNNVNNTAGYTDHDLFATNDGSAEVTAKNITIAEGWLNNEYGITTSQDPNAPEGANDNVVRMITMMDESMMYSTDGTTDGKIFEGSFQEFFTNIGTVLGLDIKSGTEILNNHVTLASNINDSRDSVSGVSLDEEGMNILQYQQAYNASARLMTALDEALDKLINETGIVGR